MRGPRYKCIMCGLRFKTVHHARAHLERRHPGGATWFSNDTTVLSNHSEDARYTVICERHDSCVDASSLRSAKSLSREDFCETCNGTYAWCLDCDMAENEHGQCQIDGHRTGFGDGFVWSGFKNECALIDNSAHREV